MILVEEARTRILAGLSATPAEIVPLAHAWGRVAAASVAARLTQPPHDVSAMDGYALKAADGALGAVLRVVGAAPAGHPWAGVLGAGEALRLFTGSVMPSGADSVLLQEDATRNGDLVTINEAVTAGRHVRRAGQDFAAGDVLIAPGKRLNARDIGLMVKHCVAWRRVIARRRNSNERPRNLLLGQPHRIIITAMRRAFWPDRDMAAWQFGLIKTVGHCALAFSSAAMPRKQGALQGR